MDTDYAFLSRFNASAARLEIIRQESIRIEAVGKALQSLETVSTERYTRSSETLMIDIRKELQEKIEALNKETIESPR